MDVTTSQFRNRKYNSFVFVFAVCGINAKISRVAIAIDVDWWSESHLLRWGNSSRRGTLTFLTTHKLTKKSPNSLSHSLIPTRVSRRTAREVHGRGKNSRNPLFEFEFLCKGTANKIFNKFFEGVRSSKLQSGHFCALFEVPVFLWKTLIWTIFPTLINRHESRIINYRDTDQMIECRPRSVSKSDPVKADFSS